MAAKKYVLSKVAGGVRAFFSLKADVAREGATPGQDKGHQSGQTQDQERRATQEREIERAHRLLAAKDRELAELRAMLDRSRGEATIGAVNPENVIWIFGAGRTGSTWLSSMMAEIEGHALWSEPWVGALFGRYYYHVDERKHQAPGFILGPYKESWLGSIRNFVMDGARIRFPDLSGQEYLVIKEPNGSIGAPLMMEALPESRMVLLVRDPRDVVASSIDALGEGGWNLERNVGRAERRQKMLADPLVSAKQRAVACVNQMGRAKEAYDAHGGPKALVRYEELRADTLAKMGRMYSDLGVPVDEEELARVVEKHSWENIPEEKKGEGKFYRKASPGGWREDLTPEQVEVVERVTAPLLEAFYS